MTQIKRNIKRKFDKNFSQLSKKPMATPLRNVESGESIDQDRMILLGEHPARIVSRDRVAMSPNERVRLNNLRRCCKLINGTANISSRDRDVDYTVKVMVHLVNTKKTNTFQTTYTEYMLLSKVEGYVTTNFKNKGLKIAQIRVDNEIIYSSK